jgi:hypothetical protein
MTRYRLRALLGERSSRELEDLHRRWHGGAPPPAGREATLLALARALGDPDRVRRRLRDLPGQLATLVTTVLADPGRLYGAGDLQGAGLTAAEAGAALATLQREGFLLPASGREWTRQGEYGFVLPGELADCLQRLRAAPRSPLQQSISLRGFLAGRLREGRGAGNGADHGDKICKLYLMPASLQARARSLPPAVRAVFDAALVAHGGIASAEDLRRELGDDVDLDAAGKALEAAALGTVASLDLQRYGIQPLSGVVLFHEVVQSWLQQQAFERPVGVEQVLHAGVDLISNLGRFLHDMAASRVQFTAEGQLYRASEKRIEKLLMPVPGGQIDQAAMLRWIYRFSLLRKLIDRSGDRGLRVTEAGRRFDEQPLRDKVKALLAHGLEERELPGDPFHQLRLRRILMRLLRSVEPDRWYEARLLPFLARNHYLTRLDQLDVDEVAARFPSGCVPSESLGQVAWNLLLFVKKRLYPLGIVDLGLRDGRPIAIRMTRLGAELLGSEGAVPQHGERSNVIVNPDFDLILYPGEDEHEAVHRLDRFAERTKTDQVYQFRLTRESVLSGLADGLTLKQIVQELQQRSRVPLPQNVAFTLEDWADGARILEVGRRRLGARRPEPLDEALQSTQVQAMVGERESPTAARLKAGVSLDRLAAILGDLGFIVTRV